MKKLLFTSMLILLVNCNQKKEIAEIDNPVKKEIIDSFGLNKEEKEIIAQRQMPVKNLDDEIQNAYKILKSDFYYVETEKIRFTALSKKTKGTKFESRIIKTRDSIIKNHHKIAQRQIRDSESKSLKESSEARKKYGEDFRNKLLDNGLNIKVSVFGKDNKKIKLTYALFDEVWFRKFQNEGYFDQIHEKGFNYIELTDGYDYGQYMKYD